MRQFEAEIWRVCYEGIASKGAAEGGLCAAQSQQQQQQQQQ
jgi:hypothetical protein